MGRAFQIWLLGGMLLTILHSAQAAVTVKTVTYNGWKGAVQMSNGTVEIVIVPQIGRIMRYGFVGGPNMLWNNIALAGKTTDLASASKDWNNYGGDKLWPAPQDRWAWPPDRVLDSAPQTVKKLAEWASADDGAGEQNIRHPVSPRDRARRDRNRRYPDQHARQHGNGGRGLGDLGGGADRRPSGSATYAEQAGAFPDRLPRLGRRPAPARPVRADGNAIDNEAFAESAARKWARTRRTASSKPL